MPLLYLRTIGLPMVLIIGFIALKYARGRAATPQRGFLLAFWGGTTWLTLGSVTAALLWVEESFAHLAADYSLLRAVGWAALVAFALGLALAWRAQVAGERLVIAIFRPPAAMTARGVGGWAALAVLLLWLGFDIGSSPRPMAC